MPKGREFPPIGYMEAELYSPEFAERRVSRRNPVKVGTADENPKFE